jgi:hypothetical protein
MQSGKIVSFVSGAIDKLESLEGQVNGNFSNDGLIELYDKASELEDVAEDFRKDTVKLTALERAKVEGVRDEDNRLVLQGEDRGAIGYARSGSSVHNEIIKEALKDMDLSQADTVEYLFDLMKANGLSKTSVRDEVESGDLPSDSIKSYSPSHEDKANIFSTRDEPVENTTVNDTAKEPVQS